MTVPTTRRRTVWPAANWRRTSAHLGPTTHAAGRYRAAETREAPMPHAVSRLRVAHSVGIHAVGIHAVRSREIHGVRFRRAPVRVIPRATRDSSSHHHPRCESVLREIRVHLRAVGHVRWRTAVVRHAPSSRRSLPALRRTRSHHCHLPYPRRFRRASRRHRDDRDVGHDDRDATRRCGRHAPHWGRDLRLQLPQRPARPSQRDFRCRPGRDSGQPGDLRRRHDSPQASDPRQRPDCFHRSCPRG